MARVAAVAAVAAVSALGVAILKGAIYDRGQAVGVDIYASSVGLSCPAAVVTVRVIIITPGAGAAGDRAIVEQAVLDIGN